MVVIQTKIANAALGSTLLASVIVGIEMLATDSYLWRVAPDHAFGLLGFAILALILALAVLSLPRQYASYTKYAFLGAAFLATVQLALMIGDTIVGAPMGVAQDAFRTYLLSNISFVTLLGIQAITSLTALAATRTISLRTNLSRMPEPDITLRNQ